MREIINFYMLIHSLKWPQQPNLGQAKARNEESIQVPHVDGKVQRPGTCSTAFPSVLAETWVRNEATRT